MADAPAATACGPWTVDFGFDEFEEKYLEQRPAGTYDVYAALWWTDGDGTIGLAVSEPVTMDVPSIDVPEEQPLPVDVRDGYQPPWLDGTSLTCGAHADDVPGATRLKGLAMGPMTIEKGVKSMTITFHDAEDEPVDTTRTPFTLVWLTAGRVVAVGTDVWSEPVERFRGDGERRFVAVHAAQGRPYSAD